MPHQKNQPTNGQTNKQTDKQTNWKPLFCWHAPSQGAVSVQLTLVEGPKNGNLSRDDLGPNIDGMAVTFHCEWNYASKKM